MELIYRYLENSGYPPTLAEIRDKINVSSNQAVLDFLKKLEEKGLILREEGAARSIKILNKGFKILGLKPIIPQVGESSAGSFVEAIATLDSWKTVSDDIEELTDDTYFLKVKGDSMIGAGIEEGDILLVKKSKEFISGDIVVAQTPYGTTIKRFISSDTPPYMYLKPENSKYPIIPFMDETELIGKIIKIIKPQGVVTPK